MRQARSLWAIVGVSLVAISLSPVYTVGVLAPRFEELLLENTKEEAIRLARHFSAFAVEEGEEPGATALPPDLRDRLASLERDEHLVKMRGSMRERARAEERLRQLSLTDELTGLYNRRGFFALAEHRRGSRAVASP
jgi:hypothetical protein